MWRGLSGIVVVLVVLGLAAIAVPDKAKRALVTHVSDGDTGYLKPLKYGTRASSWSGRKARFIGVDTPEVYSSPVECYGAEASDFTTRKLDGKHVKVTYGEDPTDQYGRALIYVWRKGKLFNKTLVRKGYATVEIYEPNDLYEDKLRRAQRKARDADRGLWGAC